MARPFAPSDALRLRSQQALGTALELESHVLLDESPLRQAISAYVPFSDCGIETLVLDGANGARGGFVQARRRRDDTEADLIFVSPGLDSANGAALAWQRMIADVCEWLGTKGCQRVYVTIDVQNRVAWQLLRQLGFTVLFSDEVFRRGIDQPMPEAPEGLAVVGLDEAVETAVESLAWQQAAWSERVRDGELAGAWRRYPLGGRFPGTAVGNAWLAGDGEVIGAYRLVPGRSGHWLAAIATDKADASLLVQHALATLGQQNGIGVRPVFAAARGHEPALNLALRETGFDAFSARFWMVKHMAVRVGAAAAQPKPWSRAALDPATSTPCDGLRRAAGGR